MCDECGGICLSLGNLVRDYTDNPAAGQAEEEYERPTFIPLDVRNAPESAATKTGFADFISKAGDVGMTPGAFLAELGKRCGYEDWVTRWFCGEIPNGLVRKIVLAAAEELLISKGARPDLPWKVAA